MEKRKKRSGPVRKEKTGMRRPLTVLLLTLSVLAAAAFSAAGCGILIGNGSGSMSGSSSAYTENFSGTSNETSGDDSASSAVSSAGEDAKETQSGTDSVSRQMEEDGVQPGVGLYGAASQETGYYAYNLLDDGEKNIYDRMLYAMEKRIRVEFSSEETDPDRIDRVFRSVCSDHPEVFDVSGYQLGSVNSLFGGTTYTFDATYQMEEAETAEMREQVSQCVDSILTGTDSNADSYTKAKFAYDTIINNTEYDDTAENNQNMLSVFLGGRSVCAGYTAAMEYMLQKMGIQCGTVSGTATDSSGTESHAWNIVLMDGAYYYIDVTYGDPVGGDDSGYDFGPDYDYFCITTEDLLKNHTIGDDSVEGQECTATDDNYYHREGKYFTSYDKNQLAGLFQAMEAGGQKTLSIRCADQNLYSEMYTDLIDNGAVFEYLPGENEHGYSVNEQLCSIEFAIR